MVQNVGKVVSLLAFTGNLSQECLSIGEKSYGNLEQLRDTYRLRSCGLLTLPTCLYFMCYAMRAWVSSLHSYTVSNPLRSVKVNEVLTLRVVHMPDISASSFTFRQVGYATNRPRFR